jgi:predicted membrane-bound spermidine synthase
MSTPVPRGWFFVLFTVSGFAGLIYESIWSHYLKLFLGHAAYAQTLVLAIFMGGMALGSWLCSRHSRRWRNLLLGYAVAEALIGAAALVFHRMFVSVTDFAYEAVMPGLGTPAATAAFKWALSAMLILPQTVLLGMTFPLMSAGLIRLYPGDAGATLAMLYFTNSLGAAAGVLASGFVLIAWVGLPGTMLTAGLLNIGLAIVVWLLARNLACEPLRSERPAARAGGRAPGYPLMLAIALLTGAASFIYEIGWIRMLSMVLGSSTHAFELMLSAFILGLALGGYWIRRRIERIAQPERFLGMVQVVMGLAALATLPVYGQSFELMQWLLHAVARTEEGYAAFNLGSHLIALAVMFPAAFCAGMTLPLITYALLRGGSGERAIGAVYAANTVGAIAGVFFAVHFGMPALGLKGLIAAGASLDIALGLALLAWRASGRLAGGAAGVGAAGIAATLALVELDPYKMASGVYRHGQMMERGKHSILYHRDGKTATVNLVRSSGDVVSIHTNGKSDAAVNVGANGPVAPDETTMILTAALPLAFRPEATTAANIGFGSGLTSHVLLASDGLRELDSIEIEAAMVEAARLGFGPRNANVFRDPRSRIHIEDAKSFFSTHNKRYDIIVSEPSNPWVSGVASLFTTEFYAHIKRRLAPGGIFVQWMQLYEISPVLVASVFKALGREFSDYAVYLPNDADLIVVAVAEGVLPQPSAALFGQIRLAAELERIHVRHIADLELHRLGTKRALQPFFESFAVAPNSDYFPVLDQHAARARFMQARALDVVNLGLARIPALEILGGQGAARTAPSEASRPWLKKAQYRESARAVRAFLLEGRDGQIEKVPLVIRSDVQLARLLAIECAGPQQALSVQPLFEIGNAMVPFLGHEELAAVWRAFGASPCAGELPPAQRDWLALFAAVGARDAGRMAELAEILLGREGAHRDYLLEVAITARLARNERDRALALWREFDGRTGSASDNILPRFLKSHLFASPG